ncbi:TBP-associated factor 15 isoform 1 [Tripterygium wilfordii]|uniref:TBP-associated factor 15 isoform 1 n=1 Tax=Tripterygium wilfordii TaxID=458696 RepID=A0A7J7CVD9_TRIWF|nr:TBP-associated factor 15 isoform 1 [Tripterygium wilfordii]
MPIASNSGKGAPSNGSIYVCNLPYGTDETMLAEFFGTIGLLKKDKRTGQPKIWLYRDKETKEPKGDAMITFEDPHAALAASLPLNGSTRRIFMETLSEFLWQNLRAKTSTCITRRHIQPVIILVVWKVLWT